MNLLFPSFAAAPAGSSECNTLKTSKKNLLQSFGISQIQLPLPSQKIRETCEIGWEVLYNVEFQNTLQGLTWPLPGRNSSKERESIRSL
ncbi:hypothetical protein [Pseudoflavitalea rhizosphaerae]|uniref:hypothetical protein n=1 Tax=Pseudoflavitalea rhizosphaerae TaxID=1884793 RepID=UPI000F8E3215|nr:hypothetical protein [Pseudoflavitalea rhizosphaerae]